ncbi:ribosomal L7Ae/L30e/S12e/Gadd45 family protein [Tissierella creatinophila]|uniref:Ribosome-associated protein L7Ae-like protein n=1 Tax=Tissierella creatinophila DSM 6911 TaxID=1123403 RepID=A0A1U7M4K4_TISCR|nr:ribosomal L7Ae/L30e/S12e/Gadd45 family protein [Tissierella creatinophila]OLS02149.1 ribosome-associated protein L7Ae-like protein [Tissierella creatinophila DSM 6911]
MTERLEDDKKVVGLNQVKRAIFSSTASIVYIAEDAEKKVKDEILALCEKEQIPIIKVSTMKDLGDACGIDINAATAALLI